nr:hypothetical protein [Tanacetum cinerariifolium]
MVKNKGLIAEAYEWDEEEVSSDENEMTKLMVLMALANDENLVVDKVNARNGEWVKISIRKVHTLLNMEDNDERKYFLDYLCIDLNYVEEHRNNLVIIHRNLAQDLKTCKERLVILSVLGKKDTVCKRYSADDTKVSIPGVEKPWLSKAEAFILPNHDTGMILLAESQRNTNDPPVVMTDSTTNDYDSTDEL